jgi:hypothetical protein
MITQSGLGSLDAESQDEKIPGHAEVAANKELSKNTLIINFFITRLTLIT